MIRNFFNTVRTLSPECYRFRVVDAQGQDIHNRSSADTSASGTRSTFGPSESTRVYCSEPVQDYCHGVVSDRLAHSFTFEALRILLLTLEGVQIPYVINDGCV